MTTEGTHCHPDEQAAFLQETPHLDFGDPVFAQVLSEVVTDDMSLAQKLEKLFYFTRDSIPFAAEGSLTASEALRKRRAMCYTKAMIYVSFCRMLGVPARLVVMRFAIKADLPDAATHYHGAAEIFYDDEWLHVDTVSNRDAWYGWWVKHKSATFEPPTFALDRDVVVDSAYATGLAFEDLETNDVPQKWLRELEDMRNADEDQA